MDGAEQSDNTLVIEIPNRKHIIKWVGQSEEQIEYEVPDERGRKEILEIHTAKMDLAEDVNLEELAKLTSYYSKAELDRLVNDAKMRALCKLLNDEDIDYDAIMDKLVVNRIDFINAIEDIKPAAKEKKNTFLSRILEACDANRSKIMEAFDAIPSSSRRNSV